MKKILSLFIITILFVCGCGKMNVKDAINDFSKNVNNSKSYKLTGTMEINNGEETFTYSLETYHLKDDYYKVILVNQTNNHEQVILKNKEGLYVVTPSLNKSFKFDSVWPDNSSQAYILSNLVKDLKSDSKASLENTDKYYILKSKVDYPNNEELKYQKIYFDKKMNIEKIEVLNKEDIVKIKVQLREVNLKAKLNEDDFLLEDLVDEEQMNSEDNKKEEKTENETTQENEKEQSCEGDTCPTKQSASLEDIIYPLYIPANTYLSDSEVINNEDTNRVILTFSGDKNFVIVEEAAKASKEFEVIPVYGDPLMIASSLGALSTNSVNWYSDNINYYLVSSDLSSKEMISVASSLNNSTTVASIK